ncbi:MAG TPA: glycoside hydrolase family 15 protein, partial [Bryobacteraceae bacterium]|nr:glycoside hydrolase family 15 protein [Bryobacteraceae bacterium]
MTYKPIESYGVIGDMHSVALVGNDGSIDWCCLPHFDSPSIFAAILDARKGGYFRICVEQNDGRTRQMYMPDTNVLMTRFLSSDGIAEVVDFMPVLTEAGGLTRQRGHQLIRTVRSVRRCARFHLECVPAFDYGRQQHEVVIEPWGARFESPGQSFILLSPVPLEHFGSGVKANFELPAGKTLTFAIRHQEGQINRAVLQESLDSEALLNETVRFWRGWMSHCRYKGRWREMVNRSALVLKLLTFQPTGAIVAAATASLPEELGGERNWDYRYTWVRDAAFSVYALMRLGYTAEAGAFTRFMQDRAKEPETTNGPLNVMYGIDGRHELPEEALSHFEGYRGSRPVRIGNAAARHLQLDIYGELMDSLYLHDKYGTPMSWDMWKDVERMLDWVTDNWQEPDQSIWEVRGGRQHFTYSKLQCWVALDRGLRLAQKRSFPLSGNHWRESRDRIYREMMSRAWNQRLQSFVQYYEADAVDASALMLPLMRFLSPTDPRMLST